MAYGRGNPMYTKELADQICERLAEGESLSAICRTEGMPTRASVLRWVKVDTDGFANQYAQAREIGYQLLHDQLLEIADDGTNDYVERMRKDGSSEVAFDREHVQRSQLRVDTRKWLLSKMLPKIYGNRDKEAEPPPDDQSYVVPMPPKAKDAEAWTASIKPPEDP